MRNKQHRPRSGRRPQVESLEPRQVMSADPLGGAMVHHDFDEPLAGEVALGHHALRDADFWLDPRDLQDIEENLDNIEQLLSSAHGLTGWNQVQSNFGFRGLGQTVAVIDSGIAYDHWALGGGFGSNYRVVGGKDFTEENDNNPFDDGTEGSHGTHVAGIIGSSHGTNTGVAPDVDLVALRVFNDAGDGYFSWVENALQWVYTNRNAFENPITAVNLSIGTSWNANTVPNWSTLEDEFALLKSVGIFTAVSAGNSFSTANPPPSGKYNTPGLSYPAASPHVVPVMSALDNGNLANYSQRHTRAIAAPGNGIISTVPDYAGNHNGVTDDFASKSGTSMAAPYVAGASVLIREAMEFLGHTNITQDTIYNHMIATAVEFYDSATSTWYNRLHLGNAIDALIPDDEYGSTVATAYNMGTVSSNTQLAGMINTLADSEYFRFTAGITGTVSFTASLSHGQFADWLASSLNGWTSGTNDQTYNIEVVAGQIYTLGLSAGGLSHFTLNVTAETSLGYSDWGTVNQKNVNNVSQSGEKWYRVQTTQAGYLTAEAFYAGTGVTVDWFNAAMQQVASGSAATGGQRVDVTATGGQDYYLRVTGTNSNIDFRLTNLVSITGSTASVGGTTASDTFTFAAGTTQHTATVNGVNYAFNATTVSTINFSGGNGADAITLTGTAGNETATLQFKAAQLVGGGYNVAVSSVANITVYGNGGNDSVTLYGSSGDDLYSVWSDRARMSGSGYFNEARHFNTTIAHAQGGYDRAHLYDTAGDDTYTAWWDRVKLENNGASHEARGFDRTIAKATAGNDTAIFNDTAGNDVFAAWWDHAVMYGNYATGYFNDTAGFKTTVAYASAGADQAFLYDSAGDDRYYAWSDRVQMTGYGFSNEAHDFGQTFAFATTGNDRADIYDSLGDDAYTAWWDRVRMTGSGYANEAKGFDRTKGHATSGNDAATFYDSTGNDVFAAWWDHAVMYGTGYFNDSMGFKSTIGYASTGYDKASFYDSAGDDTYTAWADRIVMIGEGFRNEARSFDRTMGRGATGNDTATLYDTTGNDRFTGWSTHAVLYGDGYFNDTWMFKSVVAIASTGDDRASLYDSAGDDTYTAWWNRVVLDSNHSTNDARNFDRTAARASAGNDQATFYDSTGNDVFSSWPDHAIMYGPGFANDTFGFDSAVAFSSAGLDQAFLYDSSGNDSFEAWTNRAVLQGVGYRNEAHGFRQAYGYASGGTDEAILHDGSANDMVHSLAWGAYMTDNAAYRNEARGFDHIEARRTVGGVDRAFVSAIDYAFELIGGWSA
ncbi:MAG: S8 family serine peptidase [Pirellulales bacterium]